MSGLLPATGGALPSSRRAGPVSPQTEDDRRILKAFLRHADAAVASVTPEKMRAVRQVEDICWIHSRYLEMQLTAYPLTGERSYLDHFAAMADALLTRLSKGPDGYLGFRGIQFPLFQDSDHPDREDDVVITDFTVIQLFCDFAETIRGDAALKKAYGDKASRYLDIARNHLFAKWDARGQYVDLGTGGTVYRESRLAGESRRNLTHPHNKQSKCCRALLALYRVTGTDEYFRRAVKLGARYKRTLRLADGRYTWHYWDPAGEWDRKEGDPKQWKHWIGAEHRGGYHDLTLAMAAALYDHGVVFDRKDMERLVATQMEVCWNGSLDKPLFRRTDGKADAQRFLAPALTPFAPKIGQFLYGAPGAVERLKNLDHGWQGGVEAIGYLRGKYLLPHSDAPTRALYRDRFARAPENARFLRRMAFDVKPAAG